MKKEILLHNDDVSHPLSYTPHQLHGDLIPILPNGKYFLQCHRCSNIGVYIYSYVQTEPASSATSESLKYYTVQKFNCKANDILPPQSDDIKFRSFNIPMLLIDHYEAHIVLRAAESAVSAAASAMRELLSSLKSQDSITKDSVIPLVETTTDRLRFLCSPHASEVAGESESTEALLSFKGNEDVKNSKLVKWLTVELQQLPDKYRVLGDRSSQHKCSRFHRSQEDFSWFIEPQSEQLSGACASSVLVDDVYTENCEVTGDCKEQEKASDMFQLIANMNKTAADIGFEAVQKDIF